MLIFSMEMKLRVFRKQKKTVLETSRDGVVAATTPSLAAVILYYSSGHVTDFYIKIKRQTET